MEKNKLREDGPTILSDDLLTSDEPLVGGYTERSDGWVEPTMSQRLERDLDGDPDFYLVDGNPCVIWTDLDLAYNYGVAPPRELHPFTVLHGQKIDIDAFKARVREIHNL
jgi:hypothetical protein